MFYHIGEANALSGRLRAIRIKGAAATDLTLEFTDATLQVFLAALGLFQGTAQASFRIPRNHLRATSARVALLEFGDSTAKQLVDQIKFTDTGLEGGIEGQ
jgi:hypothetical protein